MKRNLAFALLFVWAPLLVIAKGPTLKITIKGADLPSPAETTANEILENFKVWTGAGVEVNGIPQDKGFVADWVKGPVAEPPASLRRYQVSFDVMHQGPSSYVIFYAYDSATGKGYIYLPGKGEEFYKSNTFLILRGVDGHWLAATHTWTGAANSLIERARAEGKK
ncbi:MAG TPA: hypothetical protein VMZ52_19515 [Bryobacteraceae bacterium]|nr:hypothetical protein [Bryobacteraceae bacterium]